MNKPDTMCSLNNAPVVMIGYTRVETLEKSIKRLSLCDGLNGRVLKLYLDAPYRPEDLVSCDEMYGTACILRDSILPQLQIIRREKNFGVPGNLLAAMRENLNLFGRVIFFEDDVCVSRTFLTFMDAALEKYEKDKRIFCINGYQSPYIHIPRDYMADVYLNPRNMAWGFGIWKDRWDEVDFEMRNWQEFCSDAQNVIRLNDAGVDLKGMIEAQLSDRIHTWDVQCSYHMVKNGLYAVEPRYGLTKNIGFGSGGVHCGVRNAALNFQRYYNFSPVLVESLMVDSRIVRQLKYACCDPRIVFRIVRKIKRIWWEFGPKFEDPLDVR